MAASFWELSPRAIMTISNTYKAAATGKRTRGGGTKGSGPVRLARLPI